MFNSALKVNCQKEEEEEALIALNLCHQSFLFYFIARIDRSHNYPVKQSKIAIQFALV